MHLNKLLVAAFALIGFSGVLDAHDLTPTYSLKALPAIPGQSGEFATQINNQGTVLGYYTKGEPGTFLGSFEYAHGQFFFLQPAAEQNYGIAINNFGGLIGYFNGGSGNTYYAYVNGKPVTINPSASATGVVLAGINDLGQIVGYYVSPQEFTNDHVFVRQPNSQYVDLGEFGIEPSVFINNQGEVVIEEWTGNFGVAYIRHPGSTKLQQIPPLGSGTQVTVGAINNLGVVVGSANLNPNSNSLRLLHAFAYTNGKTTDLGTLRSVGTNPGLLYSGASDINIRGQIVGSSSQMRSTDPQTGLIVNPGYIKAFIYYSGVMHDLNSMVKAKDWVITAADSINELGQIAGSAQYQGGYTQPVVLTPNEICP
jgi:probable HAF family extracellular repeat protein